MKLLITESDILSKKSGTWGGLLMLARLQAVVNDTPIVPADFLTKNVNIIVKLVRANQEYIIFNNNWQLLGSFKTYKNNFDAFLNGIVLANQGGGAAQVKMISSFLPFVSPVTLRNGDELTAEVQFNEGAFSSAVLSQTGTSIDFTLQPSNMSEFGIPMTTVQVVQTNADQQDFVNRSRVHRVLFMNFNKTSYLTPVVNGYSLSSRQMSYTATFQQAYASEFAKWPNNAPYQYGTTQQAATVTRVNNIMPQFLSIYEPGAPNTLLDQCLVSMTFNSTQVAASQNWVACDQLL